jgi:RNA polymerase sigma factor (TIGR02999 family)
MSEITQLIEAMDRGEAQAAEELLPLVYEELRRLARQKMAVQPPGQTIQATALVHEAWLRLLGPEGEPRAWNSRGHFFAAAAEAMRRIIVERTRRKLALKRGEGGAADSGQECEIAIAAVPEEILEVHEAIDLLDRVDAQAARLVKLRYFVGLTIAEAAPALGLTVRGTERLWTFAKTWLHRQLGRPG